MSVDLDPLFLRGLRLLHSRARDSADQLRQLLDEVLAQKHGGPLVAPISLTLSRPDKTIASIKQESDVKHSISKKVSPKHVSSEFQSSKSSHDEPKRKEAEKRHLERLKQELSDLQSFEAKFDQQQQQQLAKRARLDSPHSSSLSSSPSPQPLVTVIKTEPYSEPITGSGSIYQETPDSGTSDDTTDAEGFALQMGLTCVICKLLDVSSRNQLIECQECHNLYHQECHRPPVTELEINDPRHVWYCAKCTKTMKKVTTKAPPKPSSKAVIPSIPVVPCRETFSSTKIIKSEVPTLSLLPFKRTEVKAPILQSGSVSASANKPTGLASLAANLVARPSVPIASLAPVAGSHSTSGKPGFGPSKSTTSASMLASKSSLTFPSLSSLSTKPSLSVPTAVSPAKSGSPLSGLASLANAAAVVSKSSSSSSTSSKHSSASSISSLSRSASTNAVSVSGNNGGNGAAASSVGSKTAASSSLMSADKRLQIMKKKAAAKMQEKRRLSTK